MLSDISVLLIEDNAADAHLIKFALGKVGVKAVYLADTLQQAKAIIAEKDPTLVILDLSLPDTDGLEGVKGILEYRSTVPTIVMTNNEDRKLAAESIALGVQDYMLKSRLNPKGLRTAIQEALAHQRQTLVLAQFALARANAWTYWFNAKGEMCYANHALSNHSGYTPEELTRKRYDDLHPPVNGHGFEHVWDEARSNKTQIIETTLIAKNGLTIPVELHLNHTAVENEEFLCISARDLTERKQNEIALNREKDQSRRTAHFKAQFLTNMSHEIRTPLNAIIGMSELLREAPVAEHYHTYIETISNAGHNLLELINDILDITKIEDGEMELEKSEFDLETMIKDIFTARIRKAGQKKINLRYELAKEVPTAITTDPVRVRQILTNLIGNAIKFTEKGQVLLKVKVLKKVDDRRVLQFSIEDTGIGIPKENLEEIFKSFTQADSSMTRRYGGSGLGLSITKSLVEMLGGVITVQSELGLGSTFSFTLDIGSEQANTKEGVLLVIEDEESIQQLVELVLRDMNIRVLIAENVDKALEILNEKEVHAILCDNWLPGRSGFELLKELKERDNLLPFVLMTGRGDKSLVVEGFREGIFDYLDKPFTTEDLVTSMRKAVASGMKVAPIRSRDTFREELLELHILLAEDVDDNQHLFKAFLKKTKCKIDFAIDGADAVENFKRNRYDIVFMDIQMPIMDGHQATEEMRKIEKERKADHTPIVALTAHSFKEDVEKSMRVGCDAHLSKPVRKKQILDAIFKYARNERRIKRVI